MSYKKNPLIDDMANEFEASYTEGGKHPLRCTVGLDGKYLSQHAETSWEAWKAAKGDAAALKSGPTPTRINAQEVVDLVPTEIQIWPVRNAEASRIKAMASITFNHGLRVNGCKIIEGAKGMFLSYPQREEARNRPILPADASSESAALGKHSKRSDSEIHGSHRMTSGNKYHLKESDNARNRAG